MPQQESLWFRLGYLLGSTRRLASAVPAKVPDGGSESVTVRARPGRELAFLTGSAAVLAARMAQKWPGTRKLGSVDLVHAGLAGAAAAITSDFLTSILLPRPASQNGDAPPAFDPLDAALSGAGRGLLYASAFERLLPGPRWARGVTYAAIEFLAAPGGGLEHHLEGLAPHRQLPFLGELLGSEGDPDARLAEYVAFGLTLGFLYRSSFASRGIVRVE